MFCSIMRARDSNKGFPSKMTRMRKRKTVVLGYFPFEDDLLHLWCQITRCPPCLPAGSGRELRAGIPKVGPYGFLGSSLARSLNSAFVGCLGHHDPLSAPDPFLSFWDYSQWVLVPRGTLVFVRFTGRKLNHCRIGSMSNISPWEADKKVSLFSVLYG